MVAAAVILMLVQQAAKEPTPEETAKKAIEKTRGEGSYRATFKVTLDALVTEGELVWVKEGVLYLQQKDNMKISRCIVKAADKTWRYVEIAGEGSWELEPGAVTGSRHPDLLLAALSKRLANAKARKDGVDVALGEEDLKAILQDLGESGVDQKEASASFDLDGQGRISKVAVAAGKQFSAEVTMTGYNQQRALAFTLDGKAVPIDDAILETIKAVGTKK